MFPRRETRQCCAQIAHGLLLELMITTAGRSPRRWTTAPHRLQHLLSSAFWDGEHLADTAAVWAAGHLDGVDMVLIVDKADDEVLR